MGNYLAGIAAKTVLEKWVYFFKNWEKTLDVPKNVVEKELIEAYELMDEFNWTPQELNAYTKVNLALSSQFAAEEDKYKEGHKEGHKEGQKKKSIEIAVAMLKKGLTPKEVAEMTGLSEAELKSLQAK